jgi:hypothetical protein
MRPIGFIVLYAILAVVESRADLLLHDRSLKTGFNSLN